jgi:hypothetical protein
VNPDSVPTRFVFFESVVNNITLFPIHGLNIFPPWLNYTAVYYNFQEGSQRVTNNIKQQIPHRLFLRKSLE